MMKKMHIHVYCEKHISDRYISDRFPNNYVLFILSTRNIMLDFYQLIECVKGNM